MNIIEDLANRSFNRFNVEKKFLPQIKVALCLAAVLNGLLTGAQGQVTQRAGTVVAWGGGPTNVPAGLTDIVAVAGGLHHVLALRSDGTVIAWGDSWSSTETNVPVGLSGVTAIAAGTGPLGGHSLALKSDSTVVAWGNNSWGATNVPEGLSGVVAVAAGNHSLALKSNGTVVAWGDNTFGETNVPAGLSNVIAIAAGNWFSLALKSDGTVVSWGQHIPGYPSVPPGLSSVIAIAAGGWHRLALRADRTVVAWGIDYAGPTNVPAGLGGVIAIAAGARHNLALKSDSTVVAWGDNKSGQTNVPVALGGVIAIAGGDGFSLAVVAEPELRIPPANQTAEAGSTVEFRVSAMGGPALAYHWFFNDIESPDCTNCVLKLASVQSLNAGEYLVVVTNVWGSGSVTSAPAMLSVISPVERRPVPGINLFGETGSLMNVDYVNALSPAPDWLPLDAVSLVSTSQYCFDLTSSLPPQRFYRAWQTGTPAVLPSLNLNFVPAITLTGDIGNAVQVDGINQFGPTDAWFTLATVTLTNTPQLYFDVSAPGQPGRLYRLVPMP